MKTKKKTSGAKRPWYAPLPRWFASEGEPGLLMRRKPQRYVVRDIARCNSTYQAEQLAAALNRADRYARWRDEDLERLREISEFGFACRGALRRLVDAVCATRKPGFPARAAQRLTAAMIEAERVLGEKIRGLKPAAQNRGSVRGGM